jgi:hypothetical protein
VVCGTGETLCPGVPTCVNLQRDVQHCGACSTLCAARMNSASSCVGGACTYACHAGFADCDRAASNGCEIDLTTNPGHCGACGRACVPGATCAAGACSCGSPGQGCCGMGAGATCAAPAGCVLGFCTVCPIGTNACPGGCVNFSNDNNNCGACGTRCLTATHCAGGRCRLDLDCTVPVGTLCDNSRACCVRGAECGPRSACCLSLGTWCLGMEAHCCPGSSCRSGQCCRELGEACTRTEDCCADRRCVGYRCSV